MKYFETRFLEEADEFISGLDPKTIKKILYNIDQRNLGYSDPRFY